MNDYRIMFVTKRLLKIFIGVFLILIVIFTGCIDKPAPKTSTPLSTAMVTATTGMPLSSSTHTPTPVPTTTRIPSFSELISAGEKFSPIENKSKNIYKRIFLLTTTTNAEIKNNYSDIKKELFQAHYEFMKLKQKYQRLANDNNWLLESDCTPDEEFLNKTIKEADEWYNLGDYSRVSGTLTRLTLNYGRSCLYKLPARRSIIEYSQEEDIYFVSYILGHYITFNDKAQTGLIVPKNMSKDSIHWASVKGL